MIPDAWHAHVRDQRRLRDLALIDLRGEWRDYDAWEARRVRFLPLPLPLPLPLRGPDAPLDPALAALYDPESPDEEHAP